MNKLKQGFTVIRTSLRENLVIAQQGFTMIELLVVISIIGILASLAVVSFTSSQKQARDSARKSDIRQYSTSIEAYANKNNGLYPSRTTTVAAAGTLCETDLGMTGCSDDPKYLTDPTYLRYQYQSDGTGAGAADATTYVLWADLENTPDYWVVCSNGKSGGVPASGFSVAGGVCPIN